MRVNSIGAANLFFPSTSLEFVYFEAIANSIDASATRIGIQVDIPSFTDSDSLVITITDNGEGFTDRNFEKFNTVLDVEDDRHKGIGRLVFLNYFTTVEIRSIYQYKLRTFIFNDKFDGENSLQSNGSHPLQTSLRFHGYKKDKVKTYDYLVPSRIIDSITEHFLPRFYQMKRDEKELEITVTLDTDEANDDYGFRSTSASLDINNLPSLKEKTVDDPGSLFDKFRLLYSVKLVYERQSVISAICADDRTIPMEIISSKDIPFGYEMVFILFSDYFDGKTSVNRESLVVDDAVLRRVRRVFTNVVSEVIAEEYDEPSDLDRNDRRFKKRLALMKEERLCLNHEEELRHGIQSEGCPGSSKGTDDVTGAGSEVRRLARTDFPVEEAACRRCE